MAGYVVSWSDVVPSGGALWPFEPAFNIHVGDERVGHFQAQMTDDAYRAIRTRLGMARSDNADQAVLRAFTLWTLKQLEASLVVGRLPDEGTVKLTSYDDVDGVVALARSEECSYRRRVGRDLYCTCAGSNDPTVSVEIEGRRAAPTSMPTCAACNLPSTAWLCDHFLHPEVLGVVAGGSSYQRVVSGVLCDRGHNQLARSQPEACRPADGHDCWQRVVEPRAERVSLRVGPSTVAEALDYLDIVWMQAFHEGHLLGGASTLRHVGISTDCRSREDFIARTGEAADVLGTMQVPDVPGTTEEERPQGSLNRLRAWLEYKLQVDPPSVEISVDAIARLQQIVAIRAAATHSGSEAQRRATKALAALAIDNPPAWPVAWNQIRGEMAQALNDIREEIRKLIP